MDFLITNARLVDCHKKRTYTGGVAIIESRIVEVYDEHSYIPVDHFDRVIDAKGKYILPGFFDVHSKSDLSAISDPSRVSAISQGILVEVIGQDGFSVAPVSSKNYLLHSQYVFAGLGNPQLKWKWESVFQYLDNLNLKTASNILFYAPHGTMKLECSQNSTLSFTGLSALTYIFEKAMDDGAIGLSMSVFQDPSSTGWNDEREMSVLLKILQKRDGILCVNIENSKNHLRDIDKAITFAKNHELRLHISRIVPDNSEHLEAILSVMDKRRKETQNLLADISPYPNRLLKLVDILPEKLKILSPEEIRIKFKRSESIKSLHGKLNYSEEQLATLKLITTSKRDMGKYEGVNLETISLERDETIYEVIFNFMTFDSEKTYFEHEVITPDSLKKAFELSFVLPATTGHMDGRYLPDMFSAIPTYFNDFSKDDIHGLVMKLSENPSEFYKIKWGIKQGCKANLILVDPDNFNSDSSYVNPRVISDGVELAVVNGKIAWEKGKPTGSRTGEVLSWI
ncbi:MAG: amidohydrolase family protein [Proteobacteria bacterium]|nr:amidohydrolase family protein [Pseudomonadota bacterium]